MITLLPVLISGFGGGATRGLIGYLKHQYSYKNVGFDLKYFTVMMFLSGVLGVLAAVAIDQSMISFEGYYLCLTSYCLYYWLRLRGYIQDTFKEGEAREY